MSNAIRQRRLRKRRKESGLVDYRRVVTKQQAQELDALLIKLKEQDK